MRALFEQGERIAHGAAMMANCEVETTIMSGRLAGARQRNDRAEPSSGTIHAVGMPGWTEAEQEFARTLQKGAGKPQTGLRDRCTTD